MKKLEGCCENCRKFHKRSCCVTRQEGVIPSPDEWCAGYRPKYAYEPDYEEQYQAEKERRFFHGR